MFNEQFERARFECWYTRGTREPIPLGDREANAAWSAWQAALTPAAPSVEQDERGAFKEFRAALCRFGDANTPMSIADRVMILSNATFLLDEYVRASSAVSAAPSVEQDDPTDYEALEQEHFGDAEKSTGIYAPKVEQDERVHQFEALCDLLPSDVSWGDPLTPDIARDIARAASMVAARGETIRAITMLAGYADGSKSTELQNAVRQTVDWLNSQAVAKTSADDKDLPPIPTNAAHVTRRIRRCENEMAAQVVLEHFARDYARAASTSANVAQGAEAVALTAAQKWEIAERVHAQCERLKPHATFRSAASQAINDTLDALTAAPPAPPATTDDARAASQPDAPGEDKAFVGRWSAVIKSLPMDGSAPSTTAQGATLTDKQIEAINYAIDWMQDNVSNRYSFAAAKELRALLAAAQSASASEGE